MLGMSPISSFTLTLIAATVAVTYHNVIHYGFLEGCDVTATTGARKALESLNRKAYDGVIIGHRFPSEKKSVSAIEATEEGGPAGFAGLWGYARLRDSRDCGVYALEAVRLSCPHGPRSSPPKQGRDRRRPEAAPTGRFIGQAGAVR